MRNSLVTSDFSNKINPQKTFQFGRGLMIASILQKSLDGKILYSMKGLQAPFIMLENSGIGDFEIVIGSSSDEYLIKVRSESQQVLIFTALSVLLERKELRTLSDGTLCVVVNPGGEFSF